MDRQPIKSKHPQRHHQGLSAQIISAASKAFGRRYVDPGAKSWWSASCSSAVKSYRNFRSLTQKKKKDGCLSTSDISKLKNIRTAKRKTLRAQKKFATEAPKPSGISDAAMQRINRQDEIRRMENAEFRRRR